MVCYKQLFFEFWDQWWVLHSFTKYYEGDWALDNVCTQFRDFTKMPSFPWSFDNLWGTSYIQFIVIMIYLFHLRWKKARLTDKKSQSILWGVVVLLKLVCFNLCWKSDYELGFYSNQFWGLPKLACFHETLRIISVRKSWYYCNSASSNHDLLLKKCRSSSNHYE